MKMMIHLTEDNISADIVDLIEPLKLAQVTGVKPEIDESFSHVLRVDHNGLSLAANAVESIAPTRVDFLDKSLLYRRDTSGKSSTIAKAVGLKKWQADNKSDGRQQGIALNVVDATAGLGKDAFILAALGCKVTLLERSPIIHALLADGFRRGLAQADAQTFETLQRMTLIHIDAGDYFNDDKSYAEHADVIYLDPMFPARAKAAKVKKDIALLQQVLGVDQDFVDLLNTARGIAKSRVVVKRPGKVSKNTPIKPSFQVKGKSAHFEIYT